MNSSHEDHSLTPIPTRGHLARLRRTRTRRGISIASAVVAAVLISGAGVAGTAAHAAAISHKTDAGVIETARDAKIASTADAALHTAKSALKDAVDSVDTSKLSGYVHRLEDTSELSYSAVTTLASRTTAESDQVEADTAKAKKAAAEAKKRAEARAAAEKAAAEEAARQQAEEEEAAQQEEEAAQQEQDGQEGQTVPQPAAAGGDNSPQGAQATAKEMASSKYGWGEGEFSCLVSLWDKESGWSTTAANPSGAYGIPQALPGNKMASAGADWQTNAATQIAWGLEYISSVYGAPCAAWGHSQSTNWY